MSHLIRLSINNLTAVMAVMLMIFLFGLSALQQVPIQRERQRLLHGLAKPPVAIAASLRNRRRRHRSRQRELDERTAQRN